MLKICFVNIQVKNFFLNDCIGYNLKPVDMIIVVKMLRQIWIVRCTLAFDNYSNPSDINVNNRFKSSLKRFISLEKNRLNDNDFKLNYTVNKALCYFDEDKLVFNL